MSWTQFREKFECTAGIISLVIGAIIGIFLGILAHPLLGLFVGGAITVTLWGEELNWPPPQLWP